MRSSFKINFIFCAVLLQGILQALYAFESGVFTSAKTIISYIVFFCYIYIYVHKVKLSNVETQYLIRYYLLLGIIAIVRALFEDNTYWDWRQLFINTGFVMLLPILSYIGSNEKIVQLFFYYFLHYLVPFSFVILPFTFLFEEFSTNGYARYITPIYFLILFIPYVKSKWRLLIIVLAFLSFTSDLDSRSNLVRILMSFFIMFLYYIPTLLQKRFLKIYFLVIFISPFALLVSFVFYEFNVFKIDSYLSGNYTIENSNANSASRQIDYKADTRTFLYEEVISSVVNRKTWLFGESAVGRYRSEAFEESLSSKERMSSEVGILNILLYMGVVGVLMYTAIFLSASYYSMFCSNNIVSKLLGLFIAFRWLFSWIEEFTNFDINYSFLWLMIGLCFSKSFRCMPNPVIKNWIMGMFENKYINFLVKKDGADSRSHYLSQPKI